MKEFIFEELGDSCELEEILRNITGSKYCWAVTSDRKWGKDSPIEHAKINKPFYQIMPNKGDTDFFNWYCYTREWHQFFKTREMCLIYFLYYFNEWVMEGQPKPY